MPAPSSHMIADDALRHTARQYKDELLERMFGHRAFAIFAGATEANAPGRANVLGIGFGAKITQGATVSGQLAVRVYVRAKKLISDLAAAELVPSMINGMPTDVLAVGDITAYARPTACGVSVGHHLVPAGTLGCLVERQNEPGQPCILSNNHVLANCNAAAAGDPILEPASRDGGAAFAPIARLTAWHPLQFGGPVNQIDAAIAYLENPADVTPDILGIGRVVPPAMPAMLYQSVRKHGRTTSHTVGVVMDLSADVSPWYGSQQAFFEDQIAIHGVGGPFGLPGDSGALIVDAVGLHPVALLFAGGNGVTFANPIDPVLSTLLVGII